AAQPGLSVDQIKNLFIPVPSPNEQVVIADYIKRKATKIDQTTSKIEKQIVLLKEFRTALISEVVTGKIDVRDEELK
ncbi:MAG: restriction endonuclease subunit S, partial [Methanosarcinaceae archaeon]|nr:restriction endonuclease subunit S [Methanosarcinaceae archaeon]